MKKFCVDNRKSVYLAIFFAWLIPGAGHWYTGQKIKAFLFFWLIMLTYLAGMVMGEFYSVSIDRNSLYFSFQIFAGIPTLMSLLLTRGIEIGPCFDPNIIVDVGVLYTSVAGLLNALLMVNIHEIYEGKMPDKQNDDKEKNS